MPRSTKLSLIVVALISAITLALVSVDLRCQIGPPRHCFSQEWEFASFTGKQGAILSVFAGFGHKRNDHD